MNTNVQRAAVAAIAAGAFLLLTACATTAPKSVDRHAGIDRTGKKCTDCHPKGVKKGSPAATGDAAPVPTSAPARGGSGSAYDMNTRGQ